MMRHILLLTEFTLREARRRKVFWLAVILGGAFLLLYGVGFYHLHRDAVVRNAFDKAMFNFLVLAGLYVTSFLGIMLAVLTSVGALSGEIGSQTIQSLAAKPVPRQAIVLGKWLGLMLMLLVYLGLLCGGVLGITWAISGYLPPNALSGTVFILLQALVMLTISVAGGTRLSTVANGVLSFMLYGVAFIGGWIEQIGSAMQNEAAVDIGIVTSLLVPSEAMWKMAAYLMQPAAVRALGLSPFASASAPSSAMLIYTLAYLVVLMALALRWFARRDL